MNSRHRLIGGALAAVLMVPALGACGNAQRNWISDRYSKVGSDTYRSPKAPPVVDRSLKLEMPLKGRCWRTLPPITR